MSRESLWGFFNLTSDCVGESTWKSRDLQWTFWVHNDAILEFGDWFWSVVQDKKDFAFEKSACFVMNPLLRREYFQIFWGLSFLLAAKTRQLVLASQLFLPNHSGVVEYRLCLSSSNRLEKSRTSKNWSRRDLACTVVYASEKNFRESVAPFRSRTLDTEEHWSCGRGGKEDNPAHEEASNSREQRTEELSRGICRSCRRARVVKHRS